MENILALTYLYSYNWLNLMVQWFKEIQKFEFGNKFDKYQPMLIKKNIKEPIAV